MSKPYRPSNGTEGMIFMGKFCDQCMYENPDPDLKPNCGIIVESMLLDINDKDYPSQWCYSGNTPTCTKFQKWDWGNDDDTDDPENPNAPVVEYPNQLCMPFPIYGMDFGVDEPELIKLNHDA